MSFLNLFHDVEEIGNTVVFTKFPVQTFQNDVLKRWSTSKLKHLYLEGFKIFGNSKIEIHKFFMPEFVFILQNLPNRTIYQKFIYLIRRNTWMRKETESYPSRLNMSKMKEISELFVPDSYQLEFCNVYDQNTHQLELHGYLLANEQGLGKTFNALLLMHLLGKKKVAIIAPNNTLESTWVDHIQSVFKEKKTFWLPNKPVKDADFYIVNYESIKKFFQIPELMQCNDLGIIIDEIHHFRDHKSDRTKNAIEFARLTKHQDILPMSGTPLKALGSELIPLLQLLDPFFDGSVLETFKKTFGLASEALSEVVAHRLGLVMYRKLKKDVLVDLPGKDFLPPTLVSLPNGDKYTLDAVRDVAKAYIAERTNFYKKREDTDVATFLNILKWFEANGSYDKEEYRQYRSDIDTIRNKRYGSFEEKNRLMTLCNAYEKETIAPQIKREFVKDFRRTKSLYKYSEMVILGETIGNVLTQLRNEMYTELIRRGPVNEIVDKALKKTIIFTTYTDVVKAAGNVLEKQYNKTPALIYAETTHQIASILNQFKSDPKINPLIATIQTMSTGVTCISANTIIFCPKPYRYTDVQQASDRIHRIGQTEPCYIYTLMLDTGNKPNLSTRTEDIVDWSKNLFTKIMGDGVADNIDDVADTIAIESRGIPQRGATTIADDHLANMAIARVILDDEQPVKP